MAWESMSIKNKEYAPIKANQAVQSASAKKAAQIFQYGQSFSSRCRFCFIEHQVEADNRYGISNKLKNPIRLFRPADSVSGSIL